MPVRMMRAELASWPRRATAASARASHDVAGVARTVVVLDGSDQQPVGGVDVPVTVQEVEGAGAGHRQQVAGAGLGEAGLFQQAGGVPQVTGDQGAQVGGFGEPSAAALSQRAELGGAQQLDDGADGVAAPQVGDGDLLQEGGDLLVGFLGGLGQVPGVPFGPVGEAGGEFGVGAAALLAGRQLHDRRLDQGVAEHQPFTGPISAHQTGAFSSRQAPAAPVGVDRPDEA
ncbi:hypothetical protein ABT294_17850 [Nonomuraea sp. NPDC000554]|uniref:hypothetical protein n=1 Tax=Nonomuraea sp. NPDC000554 TaxID=3154259 RepID=UPI00332CB134